jgi:hypothetical protein
MWIIWVMVCKSAAIDAAVLSSAVTVEVKTIVNWRSMT